MKLSLCLAVGLLVGSAGLQADFSYVQTSKVTGGSMQNAMKMAGMFSKKVNRPIRSRTVVKGSRLAQISDDHIQITDLDAETITTIYPKKKQYQVVTFEQMRQYMEKMARKMKQHGDQDNQNLKVKVSVKPTGKSKHIDGRQANEYLIKLTMEGQNQQNGQTAAMNMVMDAWMANPAPGYGEVRDFYRRLGAKLHWMPGMATGMLAGGNKGSIEGISSVYEEATKLKGMPVLQVISMGGSGQGHPSSQAGQQQQEPDSLEHSIIKGLGGFGHFGRKKKKEPKQAPQHPETGGTSGALIEMTISYTNYSNAEVDPSLVETTPAGYKQVKGHIEKALQ